MADRAGQRAVADDHPAQPGMGVNESAVLGRNHQMMLARPQVEQQDIARNGCARRDGEAVRNRIGQPDIEIVQLECVAGRDLDPAADCSQSRGENTNAVKPVGFVPAVQPKRRALQRLCRPSQCQPAHCTGEG